MITDSALQAAREQIAAAMNPSPCRRAAGIERTLAARSLLADAEVYLKLECQNRSGSFKERGALNRISNLSSEERARGIVAASAGNHAQGVALHAGLIAVPVRIVMPTRTPLTKVRATQRFGAEVILYGDDISEALAHARALAKEAQCIFIHPFDDPYVVAGQATVASEFLDQVPALDYIVVPVGGGGLIGGMGFAAKHLKEDIGVIGVELENAPSMRASLDAGKVARVPSLPSIADGINVQEVAQSTFALAKAYVDNMVAVSEDAVAEAMLRLLEDEKVVSEGAGAVGIAALLAGLVDVPRGSKVGVVISGGNVDVNLLARVIEKGLVSTARRVRFRVEMADEPGALVKVLDVVARHQANVIEVRHERLTPDLRVGQTEVELVLETRGHEHLEELEHALTDLGVQLSRLSK